MIFKIVCNTTLYMVFQHGREPILIQFQSHTVKFIYLFFLKLQKQNIQSITCKGQSTNVENETDKTSAIIESETKVVPLKPEPSIKYNTNENEPKTKGNPLINQKKKSVKFNGTYTNNI